MDSWVFLGLGCALGTAIADVLTRRAAPERTLQEAILVRTLLPALLLLPLLFWLGWPQLDARAAGWLVMAWPLEMLALHWYIDAIRCGVLARTLPWLALTPALSFGASYLLLGEQLTATAAAGVLLVVGGCYLAHRGDSAVARGGNATAPPGAGSTEDKTRRSAIRKMAGVALIYSLTPVLAKTAMGRGDAFAFGIVYYSSVALLTAIVVLARRPQALRALACARWLDWSIGLSLAAVVLMHYAALQLAAVPAFLALKRLSIVSGAVIGTVVLHERRAKAFWLPSVLVVFGAGLIVLR